ncbi:hypothetical protein FM107_00520 [Sphingobacterium sp. JB170]|nr:hypothetical protein FM107_00520 [Sphingobacterium sp. JB170]
MSEKLNPNLNSKNLAFLGENKIKKPNKGLLLIRSKIEFKST